MRIVVASEMAAELLNRDLPSLRESLQNSLSSVDVEVANSESQGQRGYPRGQETSSAQRRHSQAQAETRESMSETRTARSAYDVVPQGERLDIRV